MAQQHPYQASVLASEQKSPIQQSIFPAWHDRRYTRSTDHILEEGKRMRGSFELLQGLMNEKQKEDEKQEKEDRKRASTSPLTISTSSLNRDDNGIASSLPSILIDQQSNNSNPTISAPSATAAASGRRSQSVKFNDEEQQKQKFIRRSRSVRFTDEKPVPRISSSSTNTD